jgi:hypothetical protein
MTAPVCRVTAPQRPLRHALTITRAERADETARHDTSRDRAGESAHHHAFDCGALMVVWTSDIWPSFYVAQGRNGATTNQTIVKYSQRPLNFLPFPPTC